MLEWKKHCIDTETKGRMQSIGNVHFWRRALGQGEILSTLQSAGAGATSSTEVPTASSHFSSMSEEAVDVFSFQTLAS